MLVYRSLRFIKMVVISGWSFKRASVNRFFAGNTGVAVTSTTMI